MNMSLEFLNLMTRITRGNTAESVQYVWYLWHSLKKNIVSEPSVFVFLSISTEIFQDVATLSPLHSFYSLHWKDSSLRQTLVGGNQPYTSGKKNNLCNIYQQNEHIYKIPLQKRTKRFQQFYVPFFQELCDYGGHVLHHQCDQQLCAELQHLHAAAHDLQIGMNS